MPLPSLRKLRGNEFTAPDVARSHEIAQQIQKYLSDEPSNAASWRRLPELPTTAEITQTQDKIMPSLLDAQAWDDYESYLKAKYTHLREDGCWPLRQCVDELRARPNMLEPDSCTLAKIYESAYFVGATVSQKGLSFKVEFSTRRVQKNIRWAQSKRLKTGTIVALSPAKDCFQSICVVASVVSRPLRDLMVPHPAKSAVHLQLGEVEHMSFDPQLEWIMVESSNGYWEAYRHTLKALSKMPSESFNLAKYICDGDTDPATPEYVCTHAVKEVPLEATSSPSGHILKTMSLRTRGGAKVTANETGAALDESQKEALRRVLNKNLALVQGPPGTGKTTLSVAALKTMLSSKELPRGPIIVVAQTNHALDQLLLLLQDFEPGFVRLGNQTDSEVIEHRVLTTIRKKRGKQFAALRNFVHALRKRLEGQLKDAVSLINRDKPMTPKDFFNHDLISEKLYKSFARLRNKWVGEGVNGDMSPIEKWCGPSLVRFSEWQTRLRAESWEEDEDSEESRGDELDLEVDIEDEPWENLNGCEIKFETGFIAGNRSCLKEKDARKLLNMYEDAEAIPEKHRPGLYNYLQHKIKDIVSKKLLTIAAAAKQLERDFRASRMQTDSDLLASTRIIGVTLTGLSKYRALLMSLGPKIVLIEEAAQTLEPLVVVASMPSVQHLILVGDHMQLRGQVNSAHLENAPYHLNRSLFERLVQDGMERSTLRHQRRMRPEIRQLLSPVYPELVDHPSVLGRLSIRGVQSNLCFIEHQWPESMDDMNSKLNDGEARQIILFAKYLLDNSYNPRSISILTFYSAQKRTLIKHAKANTATRMLSSNIHTVDSFQGEESDIIILSLVRNNQRGDIGFLNDMNRVNVALSRARNGLYIFGSQAGLIKNYLWLQTLHLLNSNGQVFEGVPLVCANHGTKMLGGVDVDLERTNGGCELKCRTKLDCGHICVLHCHTYPHSSVACGQPCRRVLSCGHPCKHECWYEKHECSICKPTVKSGSVGSKPGGEAGSQRLLERRSPRRTSPIASASTVDERHRNIPLTSCGEAFRAYANGGVKEDDDRLHNESRQHNEKELDKLARELNGGHVHSPALAEASSPPQAARGNGRMVWVQNFVPAAVEKRAEKLRKEEEEIRLQKQCKDDRPETEDLIDLS